MTNKQKFKEVFGFVPIGLVINKLCPEHFDCDDVPSCKECPFSEKWWNREYKECFVLRIEGKKGIKALKKIEEDKNENNNINTGE